MAKIDSLGFLVSQCATELDRLHLSLILLESAYRRDVFLSSPLLSWIAVLYLIWSQLRPVDINCDVGEKEFHEFLKINIQNVFKAESCWLGGDKNSIKFF